MENTGKKEIQKGPRIPGQIESYTAKPGIPGEVLSAADANKMSELKHNKLHWFSPPVNYKPEKR